MILIADSGSTKTDWCVVGQGQLVRQIVTKGMNPFFQSEEEIGNEIATALLPPSGNQCARRCLFLWSRMCTGQGANDAQCTLSPSERQEWH